MNENTNADISVSTAETNETVDTPVEEQNTDTQEHSQVDPVKQELDNIQKKGEGRTELEKAIFKKQQIEKRIAELSKDSDIEPTHDVSEDEVVTVGLLKKLQKKETLKTSLSMAEEIENKYERDLVVYHLNNTIKPSGNAAQDLQLAKAIVNEVKTRRMLEEANRTVTPKRTASGGSSPAKREEEIFEPTPEELTLMRMKGYDGKPLLTKDDIIKARNSNKSK